MSGTDDPTYRAHGLRAIITPRESPVCGFQSFPNRSHGLGRPRASLTAEQAARVYELKGVVEAVQLGDMFGELFVGCATCAV